MWNGTRRWMMSKPTIFANPASVISKSATILSSGCLMKCLLICHAINFLTRCSFSGSFLFLCTAKYTKMIIIINMAWIFKKKLKVNMKFINCEIGAKLPGIWNCTFLFSNHKKSNRSEGITKFFTHSIFSYAWLSYNFFVIKNCTYTGIILTYFMVLFVVIMPIYSP